MPPRSRSLQLPDDFLDRLEIGLDDGVFEPAGRLLADVASRVDVDGDERFGLVDDDGPAGLEPDLALERLVDLGLDAVLLEDRIRFGVKLHSWRQPRHDALDELEHALVLLRVVDADGLELLGQQIAKQFSDQALLLVDDGRCPRRLHPLADTRARWCGRPRDR